MKKELIFIYILLLSSCESNNNITLEEKIEIKKQTCFDVGEYCTKIGSSTNCYDTDCEEITIYRIPFSNEKQFIDKINIAGDSTNKCGYWRKNGTQYYYLPNESDKMDGIYFKMEYSKMMGSLIVWKFDI